MDDFVGHFLIGKLPKFLSLDPCLVFTYKSFLTMGNQSQFFAFFTMPYYWLRTAVILLN